MQGITEGLLGLNPQAHRHELTIEPHLPSTWNGATLHGLRIGEHVLDLHIAPETVEIRYLKGDAPLLVRYRSTPDRPWREAQVMPGGRARLTHDD